MCIVIDLKTRQRVVSPRPAVDAGPNRLHPAIDVLLRKYYGTRGDVGVLAGTVVQLLDTLDLICITTEFSAIDAGVRSQPEHPFNVIVDMCRDVLDSEMIK